MEPAPVEESSGIVSDAAGSDVSAVPASEAVSVPTEAKRRGRGGSKRSASAQAKAPAVESTTTAPVDAEPNLSAVDSVNEQTAAEPAAEARPEKKPAARSRRPRKPKAPAEAAGQ